MKVSSIKVQYNRKLLEKADFIGKMFEAHKDLFDYVDVIRDVDLKEITINNSGVTFTTLKDDLKFFCELPDKRIAPIEILNFNEYEKIETWLLIKLMKDDAVFFDIGANIGWYTCLIAKKFPNSTVHSFEPITCTYKNLKENVVINKVKNASLHNIGFSNQKKRLEFFYDKEESGCTSMKKTAQQNEEMIICHVEKMDDFIQDNQIKRLDILKCDVEGAEFFIYQGGLKSIKNFLPIIFSEMLRKWCAKFSYHPMDILSMLGQIGYECYPIKEKINNKIVVIDEDTIETNFIFLHKEKHAIQAETIMNIEINNL